MRREGPGQSFLLDLVQDPLHVLRGVTRILSCRSYVLRVCVRDKSQHHFSPEDQTHRQIPDEQHLASFIPRKPCVARWQQLET